MTTTPQTPETTAVAARPDSSAAVLYVCAERGRLTPTLAAQRAEEDGREYAARNFRLVEVVTDPYGQPDPCHRDGWMRVRELADEGQIGTVIVRWPAAISPDAWHEMRHREIRWLQDQDVAVCYSWAPLAASGQVK
ncbi:hypothetical protein [Streptomyces sp. NPDC004296]|uniref:hypothetical protein n=1 Tax=Streptomyces sp. NPDC004296 TaxID=3364697 RepID=UPI0036CA4B96